MTTCVIMHAHYQAYLYMMSFVVLHAPDCNHTLIQSDRAMAVTNSDCQRVPARRPNNEKWLRKRKFKMALGPGMSQIRIDFSVRINVDCQKKGWTAVNHCWMIIEISSKKFAVVNFQVYSIHNF